MSSITLTPSVQSPQITPQTQESSGSAEGNKKSFADCLKETRDDSDKDSQTASMPRPQPSPQKAAGNTKGPHRKMPDAAQLSNIASDLVPQAPVVDPRSLLLSLSKAPAAKTREPLAAASSPISLSNAATATGKNPIAFGVSVMKPAPSGPPSTQDSVQPVQNGHRNTSDSKDSDSSQESPEKAPTAQLAKIMTQPVAASTASLHSDTNAAVPIAPAAAYVHNQSLLHSAPVSAASPGAPVAEPSTTPLGRPQSIEIQVPGAGAADSVDVRVSQRAGDVQVTVRTPDTELAQSLRQHLPELSERLSQTGVDSQVWQPAAASESSGQSTTDHSGGHWQGQQQHSGEQRQPDSDAEQNGRRGKWVDDLANAQQQEGR